MSSSFGARVPPHALNFYEAESMRGGWTVRQLERQIDSQFYERTTLSKNKTAMLKKGAAAKPADAVTPEEEIKDPFVLEFLGLKDEYAESDLEDALIAKLESFLLELGSDFAFIGRQRRLRIGSQWFRVDLLFFHRRLRCLVIVDLKLAFGGSKRAAMFSSFGASMETSSFAESSTTGCCPSISRSMWCAQRKATIGYFTESAKR